MAQTITEEQRQQLQGITIDNGTNAWEYVMQQSEETQHWIAAGILSCVKKGRISGTHQRRMKGQCANMRRQRN